jgi:hypothetical protein
MRDGQNPNETVLTTSSVGKLHLLWATKIGDSNSHYSDSQPVIAANVNVNGTMTDVAYVGDEHSFFTAINAVSGAVIWSKSLTPEVTKCYDSPDFTFGTSQTATIDRNTNRVYTVDGNGVMYAFDLATGNTAAGWPSGGLKVVDDPFIDHVWSGILLDSTHSNAYVTTASYCDFNQWHGSIRMINLQTGTVSKVYYLATGNGNQPAANAEYGGGIWSWGGLTIDPATQNLIVGDGNTVPEEKMPNSDSMVEWTPQFSKVAESSPLNVQDDADFGGSTLLYDESGGSCAIALRKDGELFTFDRTNISAGPKTQINASSFPAIEGLAHSSATHLLYLANPHQGQLGVGLIAFRPGANCTISSTPVWQQSLTTNGGYETSAGNIIGPPTVAGGVVYQDAGQVLQAFNAATGQPLWNSGGTVTNMAVNAPTVVNGRVYMTDWSDRLYAFGL